MAYYLSAFDDIDLPLLEAVQEIGTPVLSVAAAPLTSGGSYRLHGTDRRPFSLKTIRASGDVDGTTWAAVQEDFDALRAAVGTYGQLWRAEKDDGTLQWTYAELLGVEAGNTVDYVLYQPVNLFFVLFDALWRAEVETVLTFSDIYDATAGDLLLMGVSGTTPGSAVPMQWLNAGNLPLHEMVFTLTSGSGTITKITVTNNTTGYSFWWPEPLGPSLAPGQVLTIDAGAMSVSRTGLTNAYSEFNPPSNHARWFELAPGTNDVSVTILDTATDDSTQFRVEYFNLSA